MLVWWVIAYVSAFLWFINSILELSPSRAEEKCREIQMVKVNVIFNDIRLLICLTPLQVNWVNTSSGYSVEPQRPPVEMFNIISLQSSARPGCIIELEPIADAKQVNIM
jgi:hypothetical protein